MIRFVRCVVLRWTRSFISGGAASTSRAPTIKGSIVFSSMLSATDSPMKLADLTGSSPNAVGDARPLITRVLRTPPAFHSYGPLLYRAADTSSQTRAGFYDCLYVALAERDNCEMVTDDEKILKNVQSRYPFVRGLASLP